MTTFHKRITFFIFLGLATLTLGPQTALGEPRNAITLVGSRYMYFTVTDMATKFMIRNPASTIKIDDADRYDAWRQILEKSTDAMMTVGKLDKDQLQEARDNGIKLSERIVGFGAVVIIVNRENPLNEITMENLRKIFSGEYTNWKELGGPNQPIAVLTRDESLSGTEIFLRELALDGMPVAQRALRLAEKDMVRAVKARPGSIADARFGEAFRRGVKGLVKVLAVKETADSPSVMPTEASIKNKSYPISGPLVLYFPENSAKVTLLKKFTDFCVAEGVGTALAKKKP
jgi:phosphate transport system substrate-binding protein